ncbi:cathelicidin-related peptide Oh-Cath-like isoform X2 [Dermochelys coriacea]|uniref:cathelicidin-related peptide Oh-Cath-like isoform X2 n=1 Tax=Dermochelys coriacea TaxID=27794 RepID=UPI001CA973AB|nr:cathelicidin-related peptide Oh-Cath-like isoform X2 [Dermochelys coriacea]
MGRRMETCCRPVLLLVIVAAAATAVPSQHKMLSYEEAIALAVDFYNKGSGIDHAFRLLKADPQPEWDMTSNPQQELKFMVKETVCSVSENLPRTECDFRDNGLVRDCSGHFSTQEACPVLAITCDIAPPQPVRVTRWWPLVRLGAKIIGHGISFFRSKN